MLGMGCRLYQNFRYLPNNRCLVKESMFGRHLVERVWLSNRCLASAVVFSLKASIFSYTSIFSLKVSIFSYTSIFSLKASIFSYTSMIFSFKTFKCIDL